MLSRALSLATVTLLIGCLAAIPVRAQNLEAGKSPSQIFAGTCNACHKSPRGLLKTVPAGSLPGYLRQHYTTSSEMASLLSAFLISNGATDTRYVGTKPTQQPKDAKPPAPEQLDRQGRPIRPAAPLQEAARPDAPQGAKPDADGIAPQAEPGVRQGRNAHRQPRPPAEVPDAANPAAEGPAPTQAAIERGPDGRKSAAKQKLSKRGKPGGEEPPKAGVGTGAAEPAKGETAKDDAAKNDTPTSDTPKSEAAKSETAKDEAGKPEGAKPSGEAKSESAKVDAAKETGGETPALRADPVPPATPAPPAAPASEAAASGTPEPVASPSAPAPAPPQAMTASVPPPPPVAPAGPPAPPISQ
jgi:hypothetical protein